MDSQSLAKLRKRVQSYTKDGDPKVADLATAVLLLNDSMQQHTARLAAIEKSLKEIEELLRNR